MANTKISELSAVVAVDGTEELAGIKAGVNVRVPVSSIKNDLDLVSVHRTLGTADYLMDKNGVNISPINGAPKDATYITLNAETALTAERALAASTSITINSATSGQVSFERAAITGDVTISANSNTAVIPANTITTAMVQANAIGNARMSKGNANTVKCNPTAASADLQDLAINTNSLIGRSTGNIQNITLGTNMNLSAGGVLDSTTGGGGLGLRYNFNTALNATGIAAGEVRFNSATLSSVGHIYIHITDLDTRDLTTYFASFASGGQLVLKSAANGDTSWAAFDVTSVTNQTTYFDISCTYALGANLFGSAEALTMLYFPVTVNQILKAGNFARFASNGSGGYNLIDNTNSIVESVASVYTLGTIPAANSVPVGTVVMLDGSSVLTGFGKNPVIYVYSDGTRWRPEGGRQVLYQAQYGTLASPTNSITSATTFTLGTGGNPVIPAGLLAAGSRVLIESLWVKDGTTTPSLRIYMGTSATASSNAGVYQQTAGAAADLHFLIHNELLFSSTTGGVSTNRQTVGGNAATSCIDFTTNVNTASDMNIAFGCSTLSGDTVKLLQYRIIWEY